MMNPRNPKWSKSQSVKAAWRVEFDVEQMNAKLDDCDGLQMN